MVILVLVSFFELYNYCEVVFLKFLRKLDLLMAERDLNKREFSLQSGIPYMTIINFYKKGSENVKLSTLKKIASFFDVSLDYIADDNITDRGRSLTGLNCFSTDEIAMIQAFRLADDNDKAIVTAALHKYYQQKDSQKMA